MAFCLFSESQSKNIATPKPLSQNSEITVCSSVNPPEHIVSVSVSSAENCGVPGAVCAHSYLLNGWLRSPTCLCTLCFKNRERPGFECANPCSSWILFERYYKVLPGHCCSASYRRSPSTGQFCAPVLYHFLGTSLWRLSPHSAYLPTSAHRFTTPPFLPWDRWRLSAYKDPDTHSYISGRFRGCSEWFGKYPAKFRGGQLKWSHLLLCYLPPTSGLYSSKLKKSDRWEKHCVAQLPDGPV